MKISVIVPVYNVEKYITHCLDSIAGQTYCNLEIILVDDGSTDDSARICDDYSAKDSRITVIHQPNGGVSVARNAGINAATGDYIAFVDSDDWLDSNVYQFMVEAAQENPAVEVVMCDFVNVQNNNSIKISSHLRAGLYSKKEIISEIYPTLLVTEDFGRLPIVSACTSLFNKVILVNHGIHFDANLRYSEDYLFMAEVMSRSLSFYYVKDYFGYNYRQFEESRSKKYQPEWWSTLRSLNNKLNNLLSDSKEYDFRRQLKLQLIHSALFVINSVIENPNLPKERKLLLLKEVLNDKNLKAAFFNLTFDQQPLSSQIVLYMIKYRMARGYLIYRNVISKIKLMANSK